MKKLAAVKLLATLESLAAAVACAGAAARGQGLAGRCGDVELAVEEVFSNICRHAGPTGSVEAELSCLADTAALVIELRDRGMPFDPTNCPEPDLKAPVELRPIGGLGVYLVKKLSDGVEYRREAGLNILRITFRKRSP